MRWGGGKAYTNLSEGHVSVVCQFHFISFGRVRMSFISVQPHLERFSHILNGRSLLPDMFVVWHFTTPEENKIICDHNKI